MTGEGRIRNYQMQNHWKHWRDCVERRKVLGRKQNCPQNYLGVRPACLDQLPEISEGVFHGEDLSKHNHYVSASQNWLKRGGQTCRMWNPFLDALTQNPTIPSSRNVVQETLGQVENHTEKLQSLPLLFSETQLFIFKDLSPAGTQKPSRGNMILRLPPWSA